MKTEYRKCAKSSKVAVTSLIITASPLESSGKRKSNFSIYIFSLKVIIFLLGNELILEFIFSLFIS